MSKHPSPAALAEARRILRGAAWRLLSEGLDADAIGAASRGDGSSGDKSPDESALLVKGELVPISGRNRDRGGRGRA